MGSDLEEKLKGVRLTRYLGDNIVDLISKLAISNYYDAIVGLLANSYDADATRVDIRYDEEKGTFAISDNGSGMTPQELISFYRLGDSTKQVERVSPRGRKRIGKFGIETILLRYLCGGYALHALKDGFKTDIEETFEEQLKSETEIPYTVSAIDNKHLHGTTIAMHDLHFNPETFNVKKLLKAIQWELPMLPDFKVYYNGELIEPRSITNATEFRVDETRPNLGRVYGSMYLCARGSPLRGIHVYVNGRRVGDPLAFFDDTHKLRLFTMKLIGILYADDLEDAVLLDRSKFNETHPGIKELNKLVSQVQYKIRHYAEKATKSSRTQIDHKLPGFAVELRNTLLGRHLPGLSPKFSVQFDRLEPDYSPGMFNREEQALVINLAHPNLTFTQTTKDAEFKDYLLAVAIDVLALEKASMATDKAALPLYLEAKRDLWGKFNDRAHAAPSKETVHPMVVYTLPDLARVTGSPLTLLRYFAKGGALPIEEGDKLVGSAYLEFQKRSQGLIPLPEFLDALYDGNGATKLNRFSEILQEIAPKIRPLVHRVGENSYLVESTARPSLETIFNSDVMSRRQEGMHPEASFQYLLSSFFTLPDLAKKSSGLSLEDAAKVMDYAKKTHLPLETKTSPSLQVKYGDFLGALQHMRGNSA